MVTWCQQHHLVDFYLFLILITYSNMKLDTITKYLQKLKGI